MKREGGLIMNIYHIWRTGYVDCDEYIGFVIAARSPRGARNIASKNSADEGPKVWLRKESSMVEKLGETTGANKDESGVILDSFNAG